jgi:hypothetical protein
MNLTPNTVHLNLVFYPPPEGGSKSEEIRGGVKIDIIFLDPSSIQLKLLRSSLRGRIKNQV